MPVLLFCIAFGLSMDYEVFLMSRIREYWRKSDRTPFANTESVALGVAYTGRVITAAALIMSITFAALMAAQVGMTRMLGLGLTVAVLVDATLVRILLVPAFMRVLGRLNWWAPRPLARLHDWFGLSDTGRAGPPHAERVPELTRPDLVSPLPSTRYSCSGRVVVVRCCGAAFPMASSAGCLRGIADLAGGVANLAVHPAGDVAADPAAHVRRSPRGTSASTAKPSRSASTLSAITQPLRTPSTLFGRTLDIVRIEVLPRQHDEILRPAAHVDAPLLVEVAEIAGVEPAVIAREGHDAASVR